MTHQQRLDAYHDELNWELVGTFEFLGSQLEVKRFKHAPVEKVIDNNHAMSRYHDMMYKKTFMEYYMKNGIMHEFPIAMNHIKEVLKEMWHD